MRRSLLSLAMLGLSAGAACGQAAPSTLLGYAPPDAPAPSWEARLGLGAASLGGRESGLLNFGGEVVSPRLTELNDRIASAFVPRFHIGASGSFNGTRYAYAGATWTIDLSRTVFVEASVGAAVNDGYAGPIVPEHRLNVGCGTGTRQAAGLGVRLSDRWSLVATLEQFSTLGCSDRDRPRGPANFGARLGYTF